MAFSKKTWKNRIVEFANRRNFTLTDNSVLTGVITRNEGNVTQEGDAFNIANMNDLENRIASEFTNINSNLSANTVGFINTASLITTGSAVATPVTYTAVQNCYIVADLQGYGAGNYIDIDGVTIALCSSAGVSVNRTIIPLKKNQVATFHGNSSYGLVYKIYAMKYN